jgi:hypothetical protein
MASNFSSIGFKISDRASLDAMVVVCMHAGRAEPLPSFVGGVYMRCHTPEGAEPPRTPHHLETAPESRVVPNAPSGATKGNRPWEVRWVDGARWCGR